MSPGSKTRARAEASKRIVFHFENCMGEGQQPQGDPTTLRYTYPTEEERTAYISMKDYTARALGHVKSKLHIGAKTAVAMKMKLGQDSFEISVEDKESFHGFMGLMEQSSIREFEDAKYMVHVRVVKPSVKPPPEKPRNRPAEKVAEKIKDVCYRGQHGGVMGTWTRECDMLMADRDLLKNFQRQREIVRRAMGDGRYLLNPVTAICPFDGCHHARHMLSSLSYYPFLFSATKGRGCHWRPTPSSRSKVHANNPAIPILVKRFELLEKNLDISDADLDAKAGKVELTQEWMQAQPHGSEGEVEGIHAFDEEGRSWADMTDLFDPGDISTNLLRFQWCDRVKADWEANPQPASPLQPTMAQQIFRHTTHGI